MISNMEEAVAREVGMFTRSVFMNRMRKVGEVWRVPQEVQVVGSERGTRLGEVGRGRVKRGLKSQVSKSFQASQRAAAGKGFSAEQGSRLSG